MFVEEPGALVGWEIEDSSYEIQSLLVIPIAGERTQGHL